MHCKEQKGQGLLEVVIALGILTTGLFGVFTLILGNFTSERAGMMRLQAMNLAREGIETARNKRDSNWLADKTAWQDIENISDEVILQNKTFSREVSINQIKNGDGMQVNSKVKWFDGGREHEVNLVEELYDWR